MHFIPSKSAPFLSFCLCSCLRHCILLLCTSECVLFYVTECIHEAVLNYLVYTKSIGLLGLIFFFFVNDIHL